MSGPDTAVPGLAEARTVLAWRRSALTVAATGALTAKTGLDGGQDVLGVAAAGILLVAAAAIYLARGRVEPLGGPVGRRRALAALAGVSLLSAVLALVVVIASS